MYYWEVGGDWFNSLSVSASLSNSIAILSDYYRLNGFVLVWSNPRSKWNEEFGKGGQLFFYLADEGGNVLDVTQENLNIRENSLLASGSQTDIGDWQLYLKSPVMLGNCIMIEYSILSCLSYH